MLPDKLSDCFNAGRGDSELFVVEGQSASGSAKQARDPNRQAILALRGKVLNTEKLTLNKTMENVAIQDMLTSIGCGIGPEMEISGLRYDKIILLGDADADGQHFTALLLIFFRRHMPQLIAAGCLFVARPPLYRIDMGKLTFWGTDDAERDRILQDHSDKHASPAITRFKGLGGMDPKVLWDTTLNPKTRRLIRVETDQ